MHLFTEYIFSEQIPSIILGGEVEDSFHCATQRGNDSSPWHSSRGQWCFTDRSATEAWQCLRALSLQMTVPRLLSLIARWSLRMNVLNGFSSFSQNKHWPNRLSCQASSLEVMDRIGAADKTFSVCFETRTLRESTLERVGAHTHTHVKHQWFWRSDMNHELIQRCHLE